MVDGQDDEEVEEEDDTQQTTIDNYTGVSIKVCHSTDQLLSGF